MMKAISTEQAMIAFSIAFLTAASVRAADTLSIPGPVHSVSAPDGSGARIYYREHTDSDGGQDSPLFYDDGHGRIERIATMQRNMAISWSANGKLAFVQDNWGSNGSDCYVLRRTASGMKGVSLTTLVGRAPGRPAKAEMEGHYYVNCESWRSSHEIVGAVDGHTDTNPSHDFSQPFTYDLRSNRLWWTSRPHLRSSRLFVHSRHSTAADRKASSYNP